MKSIAIASMLICTSLCSMASACPMCRDAAAIGGGGAHPPVALFNSSVVAILGAFLAVAALLLARIVGAVRLLDRSVRDQRTGG